MLLLINSSNRAVGHSVLITFYAIEANIPQELDLYIPSAQEELYNWVNGPNRQFEAAFCIIWKVGRVWFLSDGG